MIILLILFSLVTFLLIRYQWSRRHFNCAALKLNGPISLPIIGSTYPFIFCKTEDLLQKIYEIVKKFDNPLGFWLGPQLIVIFKDPQHIEKIMCSSKFSHKHNIYDLMKDFLGEGLITASGQNYKLHKKVIQPLFNIEFTRECVQVFEKHMRVCIEQLEAFVEKDYFNVEDTIHACTADITGDIILGYNFESQNGKHVEYIDGFTEVYQIVFTRLAKPWLHPDLIFRFSTLGRKLQRICQLSNKLKDKVFASSYERRKWAKNDLVVPPIVDKIAQYIESDPGSISTDVFWSHLISLYMASQDTIAIVTSAACLCFGMYPEYQKKVVQEIYDVIGKNTDLRIQDIAKLHFLDMCVKEILRLFPVGPYIFRKNLENQQIDKWLLPKDCGIGIPIYNLHRDPQYWKKPNDFYPDHFLPEVEKSRPSFTYIPFSAGPRGCIGKVFANIGVKIMLIHLMQHFEIESEGKLSNVKFTMDISTRSLNGYMVKIKKRSN